MVLPCVLHPEAQIVAWLLLVGEFDIAVPVGGRGAAVLSDEDRQEILDSILRGDLVQQSKGFAPIAVLEAIEGFLVGLDMLVCEEGVR